MRFFFLQVGNTKAGRNTAVKTINPRLVGSGTAAGASGTGSCWPPGATLDQGEGGAASEAFALLIIGGMSDWKETVALLPA